MLLTSGMVERWWVGPLGGCGCRLCSELRVRMDVGVWCGFCVDTRVLEEGQIFCAVVGEKVDGHQFVGRALELGALGVMVERGHEWLVSDSLVHGRLFIEVEQTVPAIVRLAAAWRARFTGVVMGVTGSVGKTTTKEMLRSILACGERSFFVSPGNLNSLLGVALSLLRMELTVDMAVFEVGINDVGEMDEIVSLLRPTYGLITMVAHSHTKGLGSVEGVACEKLKLFSGFGASNVGIVNGDCAELDMSFQHPVVYFGRHAGNNVRAVNITQVLHDGVYETHFVLKLFRRSMTVHVQGWHDALIDNALGAAAAATVLGCSDEAIIQGLWSFSGVEGRFQRRAVAGGRGFIIDDCYNASPESMRAALIAFSKLTAKKKIAVLGDMLELGAKELPMHRQVGRLLGRIQGVDHLILVGPLAAVIAKPITYLDQVTLVSTWREAYQHLEPLLEPGVLVLVKASHGVGLSNLVQECVTG